MEENYEYIISACLCGEKCRYDGKGYVVENVMKLVESGKALMVCPEVMGGMSIPRFPCEIKGDRVINKNGEDKTAHFENGAEKVLALANKYNIKKAILKEKSPSCGSHFIYDGTFSKTLIKGEGITAKLLRENGIHVMSDEEI